MAEMVHKAAELEQVSESEYQFVASDETPDRYGDIIRADGWNLTNYKRNPIVLFQHDANNPVGIATKTWIESKKLMIRIKLAAEGTSPFIDTLRKLLAQKIIRAVSVGFAPLEAPNYIRDEQNDRVTGFEFVKQELLENSLVSVPANPNALVQAKALHVPEMHIQRIFQSPRPDASVQMALNQRSLELVNVRRRGQTFS